MSRGGGSTQTTTASSYPDAVLDTYRQTGLEAAARAAGTPGYTFSYYAKRNPKQADETWDQYYARINGLLPPTAAPWLPLSERAKMAGVDPQTQGAINYYTQGTGLGSSGLAALGGNQQAIGQFFNPFQENVLNQVRNQYGLLNQQAQMGVNDQATLARAFGGSRHGVASGIASGEIARGLGNQLSGLQYQGFNDAMGRAGQAAGIGFGSARGLSELGPYAQMMNDPNLRQAYLLQQFGQGWPSGQTTRATQPVGRNPAMDWIGLLLGGAALL